MTQHFQTIPHNGQANLTLHIAHDPAFLEGVQAGRQHLLAGDLSTCSDWSIIDHLIQCVLHKPGPESQERTHQICQTLGIAPPTPSYHLGLAAGCLSVFAEAALTSSQAKTDPSSSPAYTVLTLSHPAFLIGMHQGKELYHQEHGQGASFKDLSLLAFYEDYLAPFEFDPFANAGVLLGWMRAFVLSGLCLEWSAENTDFLTGYSIAAQGWRAWKESRTLTDSTFVSLLSAVLAPRMLATIPPEKLQPAEMFQIGYAFGLVRALLITPGIQIEEGIVDGGDV